MRRIDCDPQRTSSTTHSQDIGLHSVDITLFSAQAAILTIDNMTGNGQKADNMAALIDAMKADIIADILRMSCATASLRVAIDREGQD